MTGIKMIRFDKTPILFDVDDTLVIWDRNAHLSDLIKCIDPYSQEELYLNPHKHHIRLLKEKHTRGDLIVVWSAGGALWAEAVVKALGLENYVDLVLDKPKSYVDDLDVNDWLKERIYINANSKWKNNNK